MITATPSLKTSKSKGLRMLRVIDSQALWAREITVEADGTVYAVRWFRAVAEATGLFLVTNQKSGEVYECTPARKECNCRGRKNGYQCKHIDMLDALLASGRLMD